MKKAATQALLALGYPYALEIPPEAFDKPRPPGFRQNPLAQAKTLIVANALGPAAFATMLFVLHGRREHLQTLGVALLSLGASTLLPMFLLLMGLKKKSWALKLLGSAGLVLPGLAVGALSLLLLLKELLGGNRDLISLILTSGGVGFGLFQLVGTYLLHSPKREE